MCTGWPDWGVKLNFGYIRQESAKSSEVVIADLVPDIFPNLDGCKVLEVA